MCFEPYDEVVFPTNVDMIADGVAGEVGWVMRVVGDRQLVVYVPDVGELTVDVDDVEKVD